MPFRFEELPAELRNKVYAYSLVTGEENPLRYKYVRRTKSRTWKSLKNYKRASIGLLGVSKQIHAEATKIFYDRNQFLFDSIGGPSFTTAIRVAFLHDIKSVQVKLNLARSSAYKQQAEEALAFQLPLLVNLSTVTFDLEGRDMPQDPRIEDQILACIRSFQKLKRIDIKGTQYDQFPGDLPNMRDWRFIELLRDALSLRWVEWVNEVQERPPTRVTFRKWLGPMPKSFKEWAPGKGQVNPAWGMGDLGTDWGALDETADYSGWEAYSEDYKKIVLASISGVLVQI
ncbi:MAG: hypothetical protein M1835_000998 [Candelina submexicana]|nr:MAG: hypothetical protein M1835_000998 [Candelina submexicana]